MAFIGDLASAAGNGNTTAVTAKGGGLYQVAVGGTFDSATVKIQVEAPEPVTEFIQVGSDITAASIENVRIPAGARVRLNIAGGGGSVSINGSLSLLGPR